MIKKTLIIALAFVCAFGFSEFLIGNILGLPRYGVKEKMKGVRSTRGHHNIYMPYSQYWGSKEKFGIYKRNNLGLPGIDADTGIYKKYIYILGSSFIENGYMKPEAMSTSVMQNLLNSNNSNYSVLNLGYNGFDPYDSYRLVHFYEDIFKPESIILVINAYDSDSYKKVEDPFNINKNSFSVDKSILSKANILIKNNFSIARLILTLTQGVTFEQVVEPPEENDATKVNLTDLETCIYQYGKKYREKFVCLSIMNNDTINKRLDDFCKLNNVNFEYSKIMTSENQIIGDWHLNEKGNMVLGNFLFEVFRKHYLLQK
jgi:hypothetical protein